MTVCPLLSGMGPPVFHLCTPVPGGPSCPQVHPGHLPSLIAQLRSLLFLALGSGQGPSPPGSEPPPCRGTNLWSFCLPLTQKPRGHFPKEIQLLLLLGGAECLRPSQIRALKLHVQAGGVRPCGLQKVVGSWGALVHGIRALIRRDMRGVRPPLEDSDSKKPAGGDVGSHHIWCCRDVELLSSPDTRRVNAWSVVFCYSSSKGLRHPHPLSSGASVAPELQTAISGMAGEARRDGPPLPRALDPLPLALRAPAPSRRSLWVLAISMKEGGRGEGEGEGGGRWKHRLKIESNSN